MNSRLCKIIVVCSWLALLLASCAAPSPTPTLTPEPSLTPPPIPSATALPLPTATLAPVKLRVLMLPFLSFAPFQIADEEGYFADQGLEIEFVRIDNTDDTVPLLAQGQLDVASGPLRVSMLNAMAEGLNIKFVADRGYVDAQGCPYTAIMARRELVDQGLLSDVAQIKGRRLDVNRVFLEGYWIEQWLATAGLSFKDVELMNIQPALELEALKTGQVDVTISSEPWVTRIVEDGGGVLWVPIQDVMPGKQFAFVLFGRSLLEGNRDAGNRFMVAYLQGVRQYNEGKTQRNLDLMAKFSGLDRQLLMDSCWIPIRSDGSVTLQGVFDYQDWAVAKGYANGGVTAEQCWDGSFIAYANQVLGPAQ